MTQKKLLTYADLDPDIREDYEDLDDAAKQHPLEWKGKVIRFKGNSCILWLWHTNSINLNDMIVALGIQQENWRNDPDIRQFYRMMGYSLCGYLDVFPKDSEE